MTAPFLSEDYPWDKTCPICGREFFPTVEWRFKRGKSSNPTYICSYPCCREYDRREEKKMEREYRAFIPYFEKILSTMRATGYTVTTKEITNGVSTQVPKKRVQAFWIRFVSKKSVVKTRRGYKWEDV